MILVYIKRQHTSHERAEEMKLEKNHIRWWWSFFFVHIHNSTWITWMWMLMGEKKSISEVVSFNCFWSWRFFSSAVQYSKQSSLTIAYISTVRNGRQRIKNRHRRENNVVINDNWTLEIFEQNVKEKTSSLASRCCGAQSSLSMSLNSETSCSPPSNSFVYSSAHSNEHDRVTMFIMDNEKW